MGNLDYETIEGRFAEMSRGESHIRSALVFGSRARSVPPPDQWSDLDLLAFATNPDHFLQEQGWIASIGEVTIAFAQSGVFGTGVEIRILFQEELDVDFLFLPDENKAQLLASTEVANWLEPGYRLLVDKDERLTAFLKVLNYRSKAAGIPQGDGEYRNLVGDFFFQVVWASKKLSRGEVLVAKSCCDVYMKELLLRMVHWTHALRHPQEQATGYGQRFFESWVDADVLQQFSQTYARYDRSEIGSAIGRTATLFSRLAKETANRLGYAYPDTFESSAMRVLSRCLNVSLESLQDNKSLKLTP